MNKVKRGTILSASTIEGDAVRNSQGEDLGKIEDVMLNMESGEIQYAVLSFGGFLGMGDKLFAIPWKALSLKTEEHAFVLDVDKEKLENAPGFDKNDWPSFADESFRSSINEYYSGVGDYRLAS